jgi:hypothetical protein
LYWQERFESRQASSLSIDDFCIAEGVSRSTFYRWAQRLRDGIPDAVREEGEIPTLAELAQPKFLPISLTASPVEIKLPNAGVVRLPIGVGEAVLRVIETMSRLPQRSFYLFCAMEHLSGASDHRAAV